MSILADVDRGLAIKKEMDQLKNELEDIETRLEAAGLKGDQVDLVDADREGKQYLAKGSDRIVPVVFTADLLRQSFTSMSAAHIKIKNVAGGHLRSFYMPQTTYKTLHESGKKFRAAASEILGKEAPAFITACLQTDKDGVPKSAIKIEWERAMEKEVA